MVGFHFSKFGCCKPTLPKNTPSRFFLFFLEFGKFSQNRHKEQFKLNISEVKKLSRYYRGGAEVAVESLKKIK